MQQSAPLVTVDSDPLILFPDLRPLRDATERGDWALLSATLANLPDDDSRSYALSVVADNYRSEDLLTRTTVTHPDDVLAGTLLGARLVRKAWQARSGLQPQYVTRGQFDTFHRILRRAERVLIEVTARDPDQVNAWTERLSTCRGLELGPNEARRRYDQIARRAPHHVGAQAKYLQQVCPKWGGSVEEMMAFARDRTRESPPGSANAALIAIAHVERWLDLDENAGQAYLQQEPVGAEIAEAAAHSVLHPDFQPGYRWVWAHSWFALAYSVRGDHRSAAPHFRELGDRYDALPWGYLGNSAKMFHHHRSRALAEG